jgi:hypothetical protein
MYLFVLAGNDYPVIPVRRGLLGYFEVGRTSGNQSLDEFFDIRPSIYRLRSCKSVAPTVSQSGLFLVTLGERSHSILFIFVSYHHDAIQSNSQSQSDCLPKPEYTAATSIIYRVPNFRVSNTGNLLCGMNSCRRHCLEAMIITIALIESLQPLPLRLQFLPRWL